MANKYVILNRADDTFWGYSQTLNAVDSVLQYAIDYNATKDPETVDISYYVSLKNTASTGALNALRVTENANAQNSQGAGSQGAQGPAGAGSQGAQGPAGAGTVLRTTHTINLPAISGNSEFTFDVSIVGAVMQDAVIVTPPPAFNGYFTIMGWVQSNNTVRVQIRNLTSYIDRSSETWTIAIVKANSDGADGGAAGVQGAQGFIGNQGSTGAPGSGASSSYTLISSASYTADINESLLIDTSTNAITVTLPGAPTTGCIINFVDACIGSNTFQINNLTINRNGKNIMGLAENLIINVGKISFSLFYNGIEWRLI